MQKEQLRLDFKKQRSLLSSNLIEEYSIKVANRLIQLPIWQFSFYHVFLSITKNKEFDTEPILSILQGKDKHVVVPKVYQGDLKHYLLADNTVLRTSTFGIPEPEAGIEIPETQLDVVFVPLLAFDVKGNRVGYGGGYYDRFLKKCRPDVIKIGLSFFDAIEQIEDVNENDIPLTYCVTPEKVYEF